MRASVRNEGKISKLQFTVEAGPTAAVSLTLRVLCGLCPLHPPPPHPGTCKPPLASCLLDLSLQVLCSVPEYDELPVRHNEDKLNAAMARGCRFPVDARTADDPHTKAQLLLQAHLSRSPLPISDYVTDTKGVLDNSLRILQVRGRRGGARGPLVRGVRGGGVYGGLWRGRGQCSENSEN